MSYRIITASLTALGLMAGLATPPTPAHAEGAVQEFNCDIITACAGDGTCAPGDGAVSLRFAPVKLDENGAGDLTVSYGDVTADVRSLGFTGPFVWQDARGQNTLLPGDQSALVWHRIDLDQPHDDDVLFLTCEGFE